MYTLLLERKQPLLSRRNDHRYWIYNKSHTKSLQVIIKECLKIRNFWLTINIKKRRETEATKYLLKTQHTQWQTKSQKDEIFSINQCWPIQQPITYTRIKVSRSTFHHRQSRLFYKIHQTQIFYKTHQTQISLFYKTHQCLGKLKKKMKHKQNQNKAPEQKLWNTNIEI